MSLSSRLAFFSKIFQRSAELETYVQKAWGHRIHPGGTTFYVTTTYSNGVTDYYVSAPNGEREIYVALNTATIGDQFPVYQYVSGTHLENPCSGELQNTIVKKLDVKFTLEHQYRSEMGPTTFDGSISGVQGTLTLHPSTWTDEYVYGLHREVVIDGAPILGPDNHHPFEEREPYTTEEYEKQIALAAKNSAELTDVNIQARVNKVKSGDNTGETNWFIDTVWDNVDLVMKGLVLDSEDGDDINGVSGAYTSDPIVLPQSLHSRNKIYVRLSGVDGVGNSFDIKDTLTNRGTSEIPEFYSDGLVLASIYSYDEGESYYLQVANPHTVTFSAEGPGKAQAFIDDGDPGTEFFSPATKKFGTESYFEVTPDEGKFYKFCEITGPLSTETFYDYWSPEEWDDYTFNYDVNYKFNFSEKQFDVVVTTTLEGSVYDGFSYTFSDEELTEEQFNHGFWIHVTGTDGQEVQFDFPAGLTHNEDLGGDYWSGELEIAGVTGYWYILAQFNHGHYELQVYPD